MTAQVSLPRLDEQVLALAGVVQVARLVDQISRTGSYPLEFLEPSIHSLFAFEADNVADMYSGVGGVKLGLQNLAAMLANQQDNDQRDMVRYVFAILHLERKFSANPEMMSVVRSRLEHASFKADHFAGHVGETCQSIAGIYQDTLSHLKFRIKVTGSAQHLNDAKNADLIRALLLAGIRAAFAWRQLGGVRWKLAFQRRKILQRAQELSRQLTVV